MKLKKSKKMALILSLSLGLTAPVWVADAQPIEVIVDHSLVTPQYGSDANARGLTAQGAYPDGTSFEIIVEALAGTSFTGTAYADAYGIYNAVSGTLNIGDNTISSIATSGTGNSIAIFTTGGAMGYGILNHGTLTTGNNTIVATAIRGEIECRGSNYAFAYGIQNGNSSSLTTGDNRITVKATAGKAFLSSSTTLANRADAYGIDNYAALVTENNTIEVTAIGGETEHTGSGFASGEAYAGATGIYNSTTYSFPATMTTGDNTITVAAIGGKVVSNATTHSAVEATARGIVNTGTLTTENNDITVTTIGGGGDSLTSASYDYANAYGIVNAGILTTKNNTIVAIAVGGESVHTGRSNATAVGIQNGRVFITGNNMITVTATGGMAASSASAEVTAYGFYNYGTLTTENNTIEVTATGGEAEHTGSSDTIAYGIYNTSNMTTKENTIKVITAGGIVEDGTDSAKARAVGMYSAGNLLTAVGGQSIYTEATAGTTNGVPAEASAYALLAGYGGTIMLDSQGEAVQLTGDIGVNGSGSIVLSLDNADSIWRPRFQDTYGSAENGSFGSGSFTMQDGGVLDLAWHSNLNGYNFKDSQLNLTGDTIQIGDGATFIVNADLANDVADTISANTTATGTQYVKVAYDPSYLTYETVEGRALVLDFDGANGMGLASTVERPGSDVTFMPIMEGGYLVSLKRTVEPGIVGKTVSASYQQQINILRTQWSNLVQRLGDVRNENPESHNGSWARIHGGKLKSNGAYGRNSTMKYGGVQAGYDRMRETGSGKYLAGFLVDYIDADSDFQRGEGNTQSLAFGGYWTWLSPKGHYADVVVKAAHLDTDYDFYYLSGEKASADFTNWGYTMSVEYGYRHDLKKNRYIEPQAQFLVGHLESKNYRSSNGVSLHQDGVNLAMGRLGVLMGWTDENKSSAYVRGSVVRDFSGSGALTSSYEGDWMRIDTAGNTGTTFEVNVGASVIVGKNSHLYAELTKSFGGDVKTDWQANLGWRVKW